MESLRVAVLIPCKNEEAAIAQVVQEFRAILPEAALYVYDNNSSDRTRDLARAAGAQIRFERRPGKGHVVRRMFNDIEADIYLLVDGDDTYDANSSRAMIATLVNERLDMVSGVRRALDRHSYRPGHRFGNHLLTTMVSVLFGERIEDLLSGYRALSRRFVKSFPAVSTGFEIETELTVHALEMRVPFAEIATPYKARRGASMSKLHTLRDGLRIALTIFNLAKAERPLFCSFLAFALLICCSFIFTPKSIGCNDLASSAHIYVVLASIPLTLLAFLCLLAGLILDSIAQTRRETRRLRYLEMKAFNSA